MALILHLRRWLSRVQGARLASTMARNPAGAVPGPNGKFKATIFPGDGIGPEISKAVMHIFEVRFPAV